MSAIREIYQRARRLFEPRDSEAPEVTDEAAFALPKGPGGKPRPPYPEDYDQAGSYQAGPMADWLFRNRSR